MQGWKRAEKTLGRKGGAWSRKNSNFAQQLRRQSRFALSMRVQLVLFAASPSVSRSKEEFMRRSLGRRLFWSSMSAALGAGKRGSPQKKWMSMSRDGCFSATSTEKRSTPTETRLRPLPFSSLRKRRRCRRRPLAAAPASRRCCCCSPPRAPSSAPPRQ